MYLEQFGIYIMKDEWKRFLFEQSGVVPGNYEK